MKQLKSSTESATPRKPAISALGAVPGSSSLDADLEKIARTDAKIWIVLACIFTVVFAVAYAVAYQRGDLIGCVMMPILGGAWMLAGWVRWKHFFSNT